MERKGKTISYLYLCALLMPVHLNAQKDVCGEQAEVHRKLSPGVGAMTPILADLRLLSVHSQGYQTQIHIQSNGKIYSSGDRGSSWRVERGAKDCRQYPTLSTLASCVVSNADARVLYRHAGPHGADFEVSRDGGRSWSLVHPHTLSGRHMGSTRIVGTGTHSQGRVYLEGTAVGESGVYISEDYGRSCRLLNVKWYVSESRATENVLYSSSGSGLEVSANEGTIWRFMEGSQILFSPLFRNKDGLFRSWSEDSNDAKYEVSNAVDQIETDPKDPNIIYVVCFKGLYRSSDAGKIFLLLPLANDKISDIGTIAVDPINGKYLYATVGGKALYFSEDHGCGWRKLVVP